MKTRTYAFKVKISVYETWYTKAKSMRAAINNVAWGENIDKKEGNSESWETLGDGKIYHPEDEG